RTNTTRASWRETKVPPAAGGPAVSVRRRRPLAAAAAWAIRSASCLIAVLPLLSGACCAPAYALWRSSDDPLRLVADGCWPMVGTVHHSPTSVGTVGGGRSAAR